MKTLKSKTFLDDTLLTLFVANNNIAKEDIVIITNVGDIGLIKYTIFFYIDSEAK
ncbi:MAG: hypothetical protein JWQ34_1752 [Mucilaginibacter sp.]|nr:hypothetical protein [Mucilaginibacter sp.]